jgi:AraC-like DNA-binding protein
MDLLTDLLLQAGVQRRLLDLRRLSTKTALRFPCDRSIGLHVVTQGRVHVHAPSLAAPLPLQAGDIALMARGCDHVVSTAADLAGMQVETITSSFVDTAADAAPTDADSAVISGAYQLWHTPVHPFFAEIPDWVVLRGDRMPKLGPLALTVGLLAEEVSRRELGADTVVHGLLDVIFTYVLRDVVAQHDRAGAGWSHAVRDPQIRRVVALMHDDCARPWTLEDLAQAAGLSRTLLAERFRQAMGDTPLNYLRVVRMQKAMRILGETDRNLEQVAAQVGYQDAFSFSKVFKRTTGVSPKAFRARDGADRALPWRVNARSY